MTETQLFFPQERGEPGKRLKGSLGAGFYWHALQTMALTSGLLVVLPSVFFLVYLGFQIGEYL